MNSCKTGSDILQAYEVWFEAYKKNYGGSGLMDSSVVARQAWLASLNYRCDCPHYEYSEKVQSLLQQIAQLRAERRWIAFGSIL